MKCSAEECRNILRIRLNMVKAIANFKGKYGDDWKCKGCEKEIETTEHMVDCKEYKKMIKWKKDVNIETENTEELKMIVEYIDAIEELKEKRGW